MRLGGIVFLWGITFVSGIEEKIDSVLVQNGFMGNALVAKGEKITFEKSYGYANTALKRMNSSNTLFPIASVSKPITATLIFQSIEQEDLKLYQIVRASLLGGESLDKLTVRHLLHHQSGMTPYTDFSLQQTEPARYFPLSRTSLSLKSKPMEEPGKKWEYNNGNYIVLGWFLEDLYQRPFEEILKLRITGPLKLNSTGYIQEKDHKRENWAVGHNKDGMANLAHIHPTWLGAGAGLYSTPRDLHTFSRAYFKGKVVSKENVNLMVKDHGNAYGYGWTVGKIGEQECIFHIGGIDGYSSVLLTIPKEDLYLILLGNKEVDIADILEGLFKKP